MVVFAFILHISDLTFSSFSPMTTHDEEDWSDSDDEGSEIETSVLLGVPDGLVKISTDVNDAAVSRIGGHPVRCMYYYTKIQTYHSSFNQGLSSFA